MQMLAASKAVLFVDEWVCLYSFRVLNGRPFAEAASAR